MRFYISIIPDVSCVISEYLMADLCVYVWIFVWQLQITVGSCDVCVTMSVFVEVSIRLIHLHTQRPLCLMYCVPWGQVHKVYYVLKPLKLTVWELCPFYGGTGCGRQTPNPAVGVENCPICVELPTVPVFIMLKLKPVWSVAFSELEPTGSML